MEKIKPISPAEALERIKGRPSDDDIRVINDVIISMIMENPNWAYTGFVIDYNSLEDALAQAATKHGLHNALSLQWKRFPAVFSEYWDIEIHIKEDPVTKKRGFSHYVFRPRGTKLIRDNY